MLAAMLTLGARGAVATLAEVSTGPMNRGRAFSVRAGESRGEDMTPLEFGELLCMSVAGKVIPAWEDKCLEFVNSVRRIHEFVRRVGM